MNSKQMKIKAALITGAALGIISGNAYAHTGDHGENILLALVHFLTQGDHLLVALGLLIVCIFATQYRVRSRRQKRN